MSEGNSIVQEASRHLGDFNAPGEIITGLAGRPEVLLIGLVLIFGAVFVLFFLKRIIVNSVLGLVAWAILRFVFQVQLPLIASFLVSAVFGLAGIGAMLVLKFLGIF